MEKSHRISQLYGYLVCLVTVITFLISVTAFVGATFDLSDPLHVRGYKFQGPNLASFEIYKMDILKSTGEGTESKTSSYIPDDETLHAMYETAKTDRIQSVRLQARRTLTVNGLLMIVSIVLFSTHWIWVRRLAKADA